MTVLRQVRAVNLSSYTLTSWPVKSAPLFCAGRNPTATAHGNVSSRSFSSHLSDALIGEIPYLALGLA